jgi:hypothetical protein
MRRVFQTIARWRLALRLPADLRAGDVCSIPGEGGTHKIVKVLAVDRRAVHIRVYKNRFPRRPFRVNTAALELGSIHDSDGFGFGHLPLSRAMFGGWSPARIQREQVDEQELDGYRAWQELNGGLWA